MEMAKDGLNQRKLEVDPDITLGLCVANIELLVC